MSARRVGLGTLCLATAFLWAGGCGGGGGAGAPPGGGGLPGGPGGGLSGLLLLTTNNRTATTEVEPNDTFDQPDQLGQVLVGQRLTVFGNVNLAGDPQDAYRLRCPQRAVVTATLTFGNAAATDLALALYDPTAMQIVETFAFPDSGNQATFTARATFDVLVKAVLGATDYRLDLALSVAPTGLTEREPNNATAQGEYAGVLFPGETLDVFGSAHPVTDPSDVWLIPFPLAATFAFDFEWPAFQQFDLDLLDGTSDIAAPTLLHTFQGLAGTSPLAGAWTITSGTFVVVRVRAVMGNGGGWKLKLRPVAPPPGTLKSGLTEGRKPAALALEAERLPGPRAPYGRVATEVVPGELLVGCADEARGDASVAGADGSEAARIPGGVRRVRMPLARDLTRDDAARATLGRGLALEGAPGIRYAEPNYVLHAHETEPNDPYYFIQWHYRQIHLPLAWDLAPDASSVIVAVLDTGITPHPDLPNVLPGYDFVSDADNAQDGDGMDPNPFDSVYHSSFHGTHVAGTIGAVSGNGVGVAGVAWGVKIMPVRVLGWWGGTVFDIASGIRFAARLANVSGTLPAQRANVINMSLGGGPSSSTLSDACTAAHDAGVVIVASAGNESNAVVGYPAAYDGVIAVGATNALAQRTSYSNYGTRLDVMAPGGDSSQDFTGDGYPDGVLSTLWDDSVSPAHGIYQFMDGTSMASPHVAGVAALLLAENPSLTPAQVETAIITTTSEMDSPGFDMFSGWGLLDAYRAVLSVQTGTPVVNPPFLHLDVDFADFGAVESERQLKISNVGDDPLSIVAPPVVSTVTGGPWLSAELLGPATLGTNYTALRIAVNREGLSPGGYVGEVNLTSNGGTWKVTVSMAVLPDLPPLPIIPLRLFVRSAATGAVVRFVDVDANTSYLWDIPSLPVGQYLLTAGTDLDHDGAYDDDGEYVGAWPTLDQPQMIQIGSGLTIPGLRLSVSPRTTVDATRRR